MNDEWGLVQSVDERRLGSALAAPALATDEIIEVENTSDFTGADEITVEDEQVSTNDVDENALTLTLSAPLGDDHAEGSEVLLAPVQTERTAYVEIELEAEPAVVIARVPHSLRDRVPVGVRGPEERERVLVRRGTWGWELVDVLGKNPAIDGGYLTPGSVPAEATTDGDTPDVPGAPTVRGAISFLYVEWDAVVNHDPVNYEVHVSTSTGFMPSGSTLYADTGATQAVIRTLPDGTALAYGTTYYVKLIAKDADGPSAASAQGSAQLAQVNTADVAANAVTANEILAGSVTAEKLAATIVLASVIKSAAAGLRWELDSANGLRGYDSAENLRMQLDVSSSPPAIRIWDASGSLVVRLDGSQNLFVGTVQGDLIEPYWKLDSTTGDAFLAVNTGGKPSGQLLIQSSPDNVVSIQAPRESSGEPISAVEVIGPPSSFIKLRSQYVALIKPTGQPEEPFLWMRNRSDDTSAASLTNALALYAKAKGSVSALYYKDSAGVVHEISGTVGGSPSSSRAFSFFMG